MKTIHVDPNYCDGGDYYASLKNSQDDMCLDEDKILSDTFKRRSWIHEQVRLNTKAHEIRRKVLEMCGKAGTGHVTSSFSCAEILTVLYYDLMRHNPKEPEWQDRDRFILSKGQASPILYVILEDLGYCAGLTESFCQKDGKCGVHTQATVPGVDLTTGSLGHGFGVAAGMALSAKKDRKKHLVFTLLGDGECYEGSMWETAMFASHNRLNNLIAIIDRNFICATNYTEDSLSLEPLADKWEAFGWDVREIDGHSIPEIQEALKGMRSRKSTKPLMIIADTIKGKGVDFISDDPYWHAKCPDKEELERAREELG